ncbi:MAG: hypothetical protein AB9869_02255 [Verrucomicrobiia bacterium]
MSAKQVQQIHQDSSTFTCPKCQGETESLRGYSACCRVRMFPDHLYGRTGKAWVAGLSYHRPVGPQLPAS